MPQLTPMLALVPLVAAAHTAPPSVDYPTGYRKWAHVKSMAIVSDKNPVYASFGGIHHIYANPEALVAFVKGGTFPDGSVIVFDLLERSELARVADLHAAVLRPPPVVGLLADPVLAAQVGDLLARFRGLQDRDDLLLRESALPHQVLPTTTGGLAPFTRRQLRGAGQSSWY